MNLAEFYPEGFTPYEPRHYLENQTLFVQGVPVNPCMRPDFDNTPNDDRDVEELEDWWETPFILTHTVEQLIHRQETYHQHCLRMGTCRFKYEPPTFEAFNQENLQRIENFLQRNPDGIQYDVRCLDGGAWDRSTWWGVFSSMEDALEFLDK